VKRSIFAAFIRRPSEEFEKAEGCHFRDHGGSSLNYAGIFTCVLLFVILPLAACLQSANIRRHTYTETRDASIQHRLLPCGPDLQCPRIMREGLLPRRGSRSRRLGESRKAVYLFKERELLLTASQTG